ncbi:MAG: TolC family protein, partial [Hyphomicrobiales bacterium]
NMSSDYYHNLAMNNNPNLLANKLLLDILNYGLVIEGAANKPRVDIEAGVTRSWDFTASSGQADELSIMGRVSVPLNESDQVQMKQRNINLEINRHKRVLDDLEYNLKREIDNIINNIKLNELELDIENKQKEVLLNEVTIEKESYKLGVSSSLDVYESEINLNNQSLKLIELNNNIYKSYFSLLNQLGDLKVNQ